MSLVIDQAGLVGDAQVENGFLKIRYGVGQSVPETMFFKNGELVGIIQGALSKEVLTKSIQKAFPELW